MSKQKKISRWLLGGVLIVAFSLTLLWFTRPQKAVTNPRSAYSPVPKPSGVPAPGLPSAGTPGQGRSIPTAVPAGRAIAPARSPSATYATNAIQAVSPTASAINSAAVSTAPAPEITASARMYAAHVSLRTPEESDPDSKTNRQILQTMVMKALARQNALVDTSHSEPVLVPVK